jgi:hypothetical protein
MGSENLKYKRLPKAPVTKWVLFFIWPFGVLLNSLNNLKKPESKTIFWLFSIFLGFSFVIPDNIEGAADSARYVAALEYFYNQDLTFQSLTEIFYNPYLDKVFLDIYQPIITWLVANFTNDGRVLLAVYGGIMGYFFVQNLWIVFQRIDKRLGIVLIVIIGFFILILPPWQINAARMWTAVHVFFYGVLLYFLEGKKRNGLLWIIASFLFHFSLMFPGVLFVAFVLLPFKNTRIFFILFMATAFVNEININFLNNALTFLPDIFQERLVGYTSQHYIEHREALSESKSLNHQVFYTLSRFMLYAWAVLLFLSRKKYFKYNKSLLELFNFGLIFGSFAQLATLIPSGGRFMTITQLIFYALVIIVLTNFHINKFTKNFSKLSIPIFIYFILFKIRIGFEFMGFLTFFGNPIIAVFIKEQTSLIVFVKDLFMG